MSVLNRRVSGKKGKKWRDLENKIETPKDAVIFQGEYVKELLSHIDYPKFDVDAVNGEFLRWKQDKKDDIMGYRNKAYRSIMTGNMAPSHHIPWLHALDDSIESYLRTDNCRKKSKL